MPREVFVAGQILTAAEMNVVSDQTVMRFADSTARGSAIPSPTEGMTSYLDDLNRIEVYNGSAWGAVGTILQVVSATKTDTFTTSSTTFVDITGLSVSVTPSSNTSKFLISYSITGSGDVGTANGVFQIVRDSTAIGIGIADGSRSRVSSGMLAPASTDHVLTSSMAHLDSPATASAITYKIQGRMLAAGTLFVNRSDDDTNNAARVRAASSITVMEVAG